MSAISTHVVDTASGRPAAGIPLRLYLDGRQVGAGVTDQDGRCPVVNTDQLQPGIYRLVFEVSTKFYPVIEVYFKVEDTAMHYHVPLLLSPFGYTTYRGS